MDATRAGSASAEDLGEHIGEHLRAELVKTRRAENRQVGTLPTRFNQAVGRCGDRVPRNGMRTRRYLLPAKHAAGNANRTAIRDLWKIGRRRYGGRGGAVDTRRGATLTLVLGYERVGSPSTTLIIVRGPSGAGKTSVADAVRERHGRGMAVLGQDVMRRTLLWEKRDLPGGLAPEFITHSAGFLLDAGWPVIVEGILSAATCGPALRRLIAAHRGRTLVYYLRVELAETFARHVTRPEATQFSTTDMASWYEPDDRLHLSDEIVIPQTSSLADTVQRICRDACLPLSWPGRGQHDLGR